jgi:hypothetical protein
MGSSLADWKAAYGVSTGPGGLCAAANSCFGRYVVNSTSGRDYKYFNAQFSNGVSSGFSINFPNGTTFAQARQTIMTSMPPASRASSLQIVHSNGSCAMFNVTGPTLKHELNTPAIGDATGVVGVELASINAALNSFYSPTNIQTATLGVTADVPANGC